MHSGWRSVSSPEKRLSFLWLVGLGTGEGHAGVDKPRFEDRKAWINATQYADNAPDDCWTFWIGGHQPAQKWLKHRKGRALSLDDVKHYRNILKILSETDRIMQTITMTPQAA